MICPHCKKENMNEYATVCVYCKQEIYQGENADEKVREVIAKENSDKANSTIKILISIVLALAVAVVALIIPKPDKAGETTTTTTYSNNESTTETTTKQNTTTIVSGDSFNAGAPGGIDDVQEVWSEFEEPTIKHISEPEVKYSNSYYYIFHEKDFNFLIKANVVGIEYYQPYSDFGYVRIKMKIDEIRFLDKKTGAEKKVTTFYNSQLPKDESQLFMVWVEQYDKNGDLLRDGNLWGDVYNKSVGDTFILTDIYFVEYTEETGQIKVENDELHTLEEWEKEVAEYEWKRLQNSITTS